MKVLLTQGGVITMEFPHLLRLIEDNQFDTIYHEHFSYFSFLTVRKVFAAHGLRLFDVEELPTHGGSLRIYGAHDGRRHQARDRSRSGAAGARGGGRPGRHRDLPLTTPSASRTTSARSSSLLIDLKRQGKSIVGYGAPAKGNTLLNYCGVRTDFLDYTVDANPHKQGSCCRARTSRSGRSRRCARRVRTSSLILPWNLREEIMEQHAYVREWGGRFVARAPELRLLP